MLGVNEDDGPAGRRLLQSLDDLDEIQIIDTLRGDTVAVDSARARRRVEAGRISVAIVVPHDFSDGLKQGEVRLWLLEDPKDQITAGVVAGLLQRQVFQVFPGLMPMSMMQAGFSTDSLVASHFSRRSAPRRRQRISASRMPDTLNTASHVSRGDAAGQRS